MLGEDDMEIARLFAAAIQSRDEISPVFSKCLLWAGTVSMGTTFVEPLQYGDKEKENA